MKQTETLTEHQIEEIIEQHCNQSSREAHYNAAKQIHDLLEEYAKASPSALSETEGEDHSPILDQLLAKIKPRDRILADIQMIDPSKWYKGEYLGNRKLDEKLADAIMGEIESNVIAPLQRSLAEARKGNSKEPLAAILKKGYKAWCEETKRNGGVIIGKSVYEFFNWFENWQRQLAEAKAADQTEKP